MSRVYDDEEIPLPLLHPRRGIRPLMRDVEPLPGEGDRQRPAASGALAGFFAGAAALGVVHAMTPAPLVHRVVSAAEARGVTFAVSLGVAYLTAAACGALVGAAFASVTKYLRRWLALVFWAILFFESVAIVVLALFPYSGSLAPSLFAAVAVYAFGASLALPMRKRH